MRCGCCQSPLRGAGCNRELACAGWSTSDGFDEVPPSTEPAIRALYGAIGTAFPGLPRVSALDWPIPLDLPADVWVRHGRGLLWIKCAVWPMVLRVCAPVCQVVNYMHLSEPVMATRMLQWVAQPGKRAFGCVEGGGVGTYH